MTLINARQAEADLRHLLDEGITMRDALRKMHLERGVGIMALYPAVMAITGLARQDAMRLVIREVGDFLSGRDG